MTDTWKRWEGQVVNGGFPLQRYLGGSDHSAVFLTQRGSEKAAIKLIATDPENAETQLSRWRLAAKLSHPNLLRIFDMGRAQLDGTDLLYLVMEFADDDLSKILPQRALTSQEAQEMLKPTLRALAYIHGEHCVHGRLRPSNILAVGDEVKISSDSLSASGETARREPSVYDAPESVNGAISPASDVWSLGVTIVEVLTQRLPDPTQSGHAVLPGGMPPLFQDIARRCLHADSRQRWTVAQIAARLEPGATSTPRVASPASATSTLAKPVQQTPSRPDKKTFAAWLYFIPLVAIGVLAWFLMSGSKTVAPNTPDQSAQVEQSQVQPQVSPQPSPAKPEAKPSPVTPAKASTRKAQEAGNPPAPVTPLAAAPMATTPKPETTAPLKASTGAPSAVSGVVHPVMPVVSHSARSTITGKVKVRVRVQVDTSGNVTAATLDSASPSKYFSRISLEAAQGWKFTPAQANGQFVPSAWTLRFGFTRSDTEVVPARVLP